MHGQTQLGFRPPPSSEHPCYPKSAYLPLHHRQCLKIDLTFISFALSISWKLMSEIFKGSLPGSWAISDWGQIGCGWLCPTRSKWVVLWSWSCAAGGSPALKCRVHWWHYSESRRCVSTLLELSDIKSTENLACKGRYMILKEFKTQGFELLREVRGCFSAKVEVELRSERKD